MVCSIFLWSCDDDADDDDDDETKYSQAATTATTMTAATQKPRIYESYTIKENVG